MKPHPGATLPLALTVAVLRDLLAEEGLPRDVVLLAADAPEAPITKDLVRHPAVAIVDYTGSNAFGAWVRENAGEAQVYTEEAGVNSIVIAATSDFAAMCANVAFSLALYSGQMCTAPQDIFVPRGGIDTDEGHKSFDEVAAGIAAAVDALLADPARAAGRRRRHRQPGDARPHRRGAQARPHRPRQRPPRRRPQRHAADRRGRRRRRGRLRRGALRPDRLRRRRRRRRGRHRPRRGLAQRKGAITAALYDTDEARILRAADAFARAGVNLSVNLTGNIFVNQSAAFSDYHVTGLNPAGNASLTDAAFVAGRFARAMWRRPNAA